MNKKQLQLLFGDKIFSIPRDLQIIERMNPNIYQILMSDHQYTVQSDVNEEVFHQFVIYMKTKEIPKITADNIKEFESLSEEFNIMGKIIQKYKESMYDANEFSVSNQSQGIINLSEDQKIQNDKSSNKKQEIFHFIKNMNEQFQQLMTDQENYKFILKGQIYNVPLNIKILNEINQDITSELIENLEYEVQSDVSEEVFISFIDYLISKKTPNINIDNISEYNQLSQEFNVMENLIQMYENIKSEEGESSLSTRVHNLEIEIHENSKQNQEILNFLKEMNNRTQQEKDLEEFNFIMNDEIFPIPSNFQLLNEIDPKISSNLMIYHHYEVKSYVSHDSMKYFINYLKTKEIPKITIKNLKDFRELSKEFNIMKEIIQIINDKEEEHKKESEKYQKIISSLFESKKMNSSKRFSRIKNDLYNACKNVNLEDVDNLLKQITYSESGFTYILNEDELTASISEFSGGDNIIIPRSIIYFSKEYLITKIIKLNSKYDKIIKSIKFPQDSEVKIIECFSNEPFFIENIYLPASIEEINKKNWENIKNLNDIEISPDNQRYCYYNNDFILEKSDPENNEYDTLVFVRRDIENAVIPSFIKKISSYAFQRCEQLEIITFDENSLLEIIGEYAFAYSSIKYISIPEHVTKIDEYAFEYCEQLQNIEFTQNSELNFIGNSAFYYSAIEHIIIPQNVTKIDNNTFSFCDNLKKFEVAANSKLSIIEDSSFENCSINYLSLPESLINLESGWCYKTNNLNVINIFPGNKKYCYIDNKLIIGKSDQNNNEYDTLVFARRNIKKVIIPSFIKKIESYAFQRCIELESVEFTKNSSLAKICDASFYKTSIESIKIPSHVKIISVSSFYKCMNLQKIEFEENSELILICEYAFSKCSIENITIPSHVKKINPYTFGGTEKLKYVEFLENSELMSIENYAFYDSSIEKLYIPASLIELKEGWCSSTSNLNEIIISPDNQRYLYYNNDFIIEKSKTDADIYVTLIFARRNIKKVTIPSFIKFISSYAFEYSDLETIEFEENSALIEIGYSAFSNSNIQNFTIPPNVTKIDHYAFEYCKKLENVDFSKNKKLTSIFNDTFYSTLFETSKIPSNIKII